MKKYIVIAVLLLSATAYGFGGLMLGSGTVAVSAGGGSESELITSSPSIDASLQVTNSTTKTKLAIQFTQNNGSDFTLTRIDALIYRVGDGGANYYAYMYENVSSGANGDLRDTSASVDVSAVTTASAGEWVTFTFTGGYTMTDTNTYYVTLGRADADADLSNYVRWNYLAASGGFDLWKGPESISWTLHDGNMTGAFKIWGS